MTRSGGRCVITGAGVVSALGNTPEELFHALLRGESAVRKAFDGTRIAAPVEAAAEAVLSIPRKLRRSMGGTGLFAALAAESAVRNAGLSREELAGGRCGCAAGSTLGSPSSIDEAYRIALGKEDRDMPSTQFFRCAAHTAAFNAADVLGIRGCVYSPAAACASGLQAIGLGRDLILSGAQDVMVCGGADEVTPMVCDSFELVFASDGGGGGKRYPPEESSRPFDADRRGLVCGEGAGMLVLETPEHAKKRGVRILGEIRGYATCGNGGDPGKSDPEGIARCMLLACENAGIAPEEVDYVCAHATGTIQGDAAEAEAIRRVFGENAVPVSSLKGSLGHTLAASGALETAALLTALRENILPQTRNLNRIAPDCSGLDHILSPRPKKARVFLKNCFAFGGINATLLCLKSEGES